MPKACTKYTSKMQRDKGLRKLRQLGSNQSRSKQFSNEMIFRREGALAVRNEVLLLWSLSTSKVPKTSQ